MCEIDIDTCPCAIDGCSVPTWAIPIENLARGFARFVSTDPNELTPKVFYVSIYFESIYLFDIDSFVLT